MKTLLALLLTASLAVAQTVSPAARNGSNVSSFAADWRAAIGAQPTIADGGLALNKLAQSGATNNQVPKWDGDEWVPADDTGGGTIDNASVNTAIDEDEQASLRAIKAIGYNSQTDNSPRDLWRPFLKMLRRNNNAAPNARSFRTLSLGDSVAVDITGIMNRAAGYGGSYLQASVGSGIESVEDWTLSPHGFKRRLATAAEYVQFEPLGVCQAVGLAYVAQSGGGALKIQYQTAKTGGWVDCTNAWSIAQKSDNVTIVSGHPIIAPRDYHQIVVGDAVTGTGIPGGTTVSAVGISTLAKTASTTNGSNVVTLNNVTGLAIGMRATEGVMLNAYISAINPGANQVTLSASAGSTTSSQAITFNGPAVTLSANATSSTTSNLVFRHADSGSDSGSGVLNTSSAAAGVMSIAWIVLPNGTSGVGPEYYNVRATHVSGGNVDIIGAYFDNGAFGFGQSNATAIQAHMGAGMAAAGTSLAQHHQQTTQETWNRTLAMLDPEVITYKTANALTLANLQTYWPGYVAKLRAAAPNALLVVIGSHSSSSSPDRDDAALVSCDNYWRDWCAENNGAVFIDLRANMPAQNYNFWETDGLWADGIHHYRGGQEWANLLTWNAIKPAVEAALILNPAESSQNDVRVMPGNANEIRLFSDTTKASFQASNHTLSISAEHSVDSYLGLRPNNAGNVAGQIGGLTGVSKKGSAAGNNTAGELTMLSNGTRIGQWSNQRGSYHGYGVPTDGSKANLGHRWLSPTAFYNTPGFTVEGPNGHSGDTSAANLDAVFGIDINATTSAYGAKLWEWLADGTVRNHGVVWKSAAVCTLQSSTTVLCTDTSGLVPGNVMNVWGDGIPLNATISSIVPNTSFLMSAAATLSGARPLAFTRAGEITFTYGESSASTVINTPAQSGTVAVVVSGTASLDFGSIAAGTEETLSLTVINAATASTPSVSLGWSAGLPAGITVKQAWVSGANTVSVTLANYMTVTAVDPPAITCRATVNNF